MFSMLGDEVARYRRQMLNWGLSQENRCICFWAATNGPPYSHKEDDIENTGAK